MGPSNPVKTAALIDIDGMLVDTNYHHTLAWFRAFRSVADLTPQLWEIHRHIGMGGDQLVAAVAGDEIEDQHGEAIREAEGDHYGELIDEVVPLACARELLIAIGDRGHPIVLSSSAKAEEAEHYLDLLDARELVTAWTTSADVDATKPKPDLLHAALEKAGSDRGVLTGDSIWDAQAAENADIHMIGVLTGGFAESELRDAGAVAVYRSIAALLDALDDTQLA